MSNAKIANIILRVGVAFAFLYPPTSALSDPQSWLGYFPQFVREVAASLNIPDLVLLHGFGIVEVIIALWILSGIRIFIPSLLAMLLLLAIVFFGWNDFEVLFRDLSIAAASLSLAVSARRGSLTYPSVESPQ